MNGRPDFESEADPEADLADYHATERVAAGYAMAELAIGPRLTLLPGVRFERTSLDYTRLRADVRRRGRFRGARRDERHGQLQSGPAGPAPAVRGDAREQPQSGGHALARAAELLRPRALSARARRGPRDRARQSDAEAVDVVEHRPDGRALFPLGGTDLGGFFHKSIDDFIFPFRFEEDRGGDSYDVTEPQNGPTASVTGVELAVQNQLRFLPAPFDGIGLYANYTFTTSSAELPDRSREKTCACPARSATAAISRRGTRRPAFRRGWP